jgi:hypothetical protein
MARGWESKSVEQQQEERTNHRQSSGTPKSPEEQKLIQKREGLMLSRRRLLRQIESSPHAEHRRMLQEALDEVDRQLASFVESRGPGLT